MASLRLKRGKMVTTTSAWLMRIGTYTERSKRMASQKMKSKISLTCRSLKTKSQTLTLNSSSFFSVRRRCLQLRTSRSDFGLIVIEAPRFSSSLPSLVLRVKVCLRFLKTCLISLDDLHRPSVLTWGRMRSHLTTGKDFSRMYSWPEGTQSSKVSMIESNKS